MFSTKQLQILAFAKLDFDMLICDGAIRSGKTSIMTVAFIDWAMQSFNECNLAICGKTVGSAIKNIVKPYMALTYARDKYDIKFNRSENVLTVKWRNKRNLFYIYGGKDESSYTLIQGITLAGVLLDEVALMVQSFVEQAMARSSVEGSRFWVNCNPETPSHWFYRRYICESSDEHKEMLNSDALKIMHLHFLMEDNPSLSERMIARYKAQYTGVFYQKYIEGKWVRAEGAVFPEFAENPHRYEIPREKLPRSFKWVKCGYDIGGNGSAYSLVCSAEDYKVMFIHPNQEATLLKDDNFISRDKFTGDVTVTGAIGKVAGCWIKKSRKVKQIAAASAVQGVYTIKIEGTVADTDKITIDGVVCTLASGDNTPAKAVTTIKGKTFDNYTVTGASDTLTFTEKSGKEGHGVPSVSSTGAENFVSAVTTQGSAAHGACWECPIIKLQSSDDFDALADKYNDGSRGMIIANVSENVLFDGDTPWSINHIEVTNG